MNNAVLLDGPYLRERDGDDADPERGHRHRRHTHRVGRNRHQQRGRVCKTTDVGRLIRIKEGSTWGYVIITARTSTTVVTVDVINTLTNTNAKKFWRMGLYSNTTGYPACVGFYEDRLAFAGCPATPARGSRAQETTRTSRRRIRMESSPILTRFHPELRRSAKRPVDQRG